jgi:hypothetical protein
MPTENCSNSKLILRSLLLIFRVLNKREIMLSNPTLSGDKKSSKYSAEKALNVTLRPPMCSSTNWEKNKRTNPKSIRITSVLIINGEESSKNVRPITKHENINNNSLFVNILPPNVVL